MSSDVLVVGSGGREDALLWKLAQSPRVGKIYASPGNAGTKRFGERLSYKADDIDGLASYAESHNIGLTVVGPENPLGKGIVDEFTSRGLKIFGPSRRAARAEKSKAYTKGLMDAYGVPNAPYGIFSNLRAAQMYIEENWEDGVTELVVKVDGFALGKGVIVPGSKEEALDAARRMLYHGEFGEAGDIVVIEKRLHGPEVSVMALTDASGLKLLPSSSDYKPVGKGDTGDNTGGMGAFAHVPEEILTPEMLRAMRDNSVIPMLRALDDDGRLFRGFFYSAFMLTADGPRILEENVRAGDPETQVTLPLVDDDVFNYMMAGTRDELSGMPDLRSTGKSAVGVVLASGGYPGPYKKKKLITGFGDVKSEFGDDVIIFHAGTEEDDGKIYTSGGRVMCVVGLGDSIDLAADKAHAATELIKFDDKYTRSDIGRDVLNRGRV